MEKKQKIITWAEFLESGGKGNDMALIRDVPRFRKGPSKKTQAMREQVDKLGIDEENDENEKPKKPVSRKSKA